MGIDRWRRGRTIGRGSTAAVSLATACPSGEVFAVKSAELARSAFLQREQGILSTLDSPFVVSYLGFDISPEAGAGGGLYYNLFMEYAPGGSLSDKIKKQGGRLGEAAIRSHTAEVLSGLAYLHSSGVAHCDVKGQNVLIGSDGRAKIADVGCARRVGESEDGGEMERPQLRGTPMFMAPEVARGQEQGTPADIWALGCTVIEMATGRPPWPDVADPVAAIHRIAFSSDVPELPSWVSDDGKDFLGKCVRRDPNERWTAEQLLEHPFVSTNKCLSDSNADQRWISPKSTLDLAFWELVSEEEEEEAAEHPSEDPASRIQVLIGGDGPNWTWDENWMTVRGNCTECTTPAMPEEQAKDQIPADETAGDESPANRAGGNNEIPISGGTSSSEEFMPSTDHMDLENFLYDSFDYTLITDSNGTDFSSDDVSVALVEEGQQWFSCERDVTFVNGDSNSIKLKDNILCFISICGFAFDPVGTLFLSLTLCSSLKSVFTNGLGSWEGGLQLAR